MASIDQSLQQWRRSLAKSGVLSSEDLDELEGHIRDTIDDLEPKGLAREEALLVALRRMGDPSLLAVEFEKVRPGLAWGRRFYWMTAGVLGFNLVWQGTKVLVYSAAIGVSALGGSAAVGAVGAVLVALGAVAGMMIHSTRRPSGTLASALQQGTTWLSNHPVASGVGILAASEVAAVSANLVMSRFLRFLSGNDLSLEILGGVHLVTNASPIIAALGLLLLARSLSSGPKPELRFQEGP